MTSRTTSPRVAMALLLGGGLCTCRPGSGTETALTYQTAPVGRGSLAARVTASGTLSALVTVQVGTQVSGRLHEIRADYNSVVRRGQVLARIDPRMFEAAVEEARANVAAATAGLARAHVESQEAERRLALTRALAAQTSLAQAEVEAAQAVFDGSKAAIAVAEAQVLQAKAAQRRAEINLAYTTIVSPIDGMVISRNVDVGQTVAASLQAPTLFTIAEDLRRMQVDTSVAEADIGRLRPLMDASFSVDAWPGERFRGKVRDIRNAPQTQQNVVTYNVVIDVENPALALKPGMTANVSVVHAQRDDVLTVPNAALRFRPPPELAPRRVRGDGGPASAPRPETARRLDRRTVWVMRDGAPSPVPIRVGISDGTNTELIEGELEEGDPLVTEATGGAERKEPPSMRGMRRIF